MGQEHDILRRIECLVLPMTVVILGYLWYYAYRIRSILLMVLCMCLRNIGNQLRKHTNRKEHHL